MIQTEILEEYIDSKATLEQVSEKLSRLIDYQVSNKLLAEEFVAFELEWAKLYKCYRLLIEFGYESNAKFPLIQTLLEKMKRDRVVEVLEETEDDIQMRVLYAIYLKEIAVLLEKEKLVVSLINKQPFLVNLWTNALSFLGKLSVFYVVRRFIFPNYSRANPRFVDIWLLIHSLLAIVYVIIASIDAVPIGVKYGFLIYGCIRMFEILIYQLNVILVHPYKANNYSLSSYRRMTIALIHNFAEIVFWFAGTFITLQYITDTSVPMAVYSSFIHMVAYSIKIDESKWTIVAVFILQFQALIGVFMTILSLARFVSLFPQPASQDLAEQEKKEREMDVLEMLKALERKVDANTEQIRQTNMSIIQMAQNEQNSTERPREDLRV